MPLKTDFGKFSTNLYVGTPVPPKSGKVKKKAAPFSLRLSEAERARLIAEAEGARLGTYIKEKLLVSTTSARQHRTSLGVQDRAALAKVLALLGKSGLVSNLTQLARLANSGSLPFTPEIEEELRASLREVREIRRLLLLSLGMRMETAR
jgi:hypothetical protein